jgi:hypothetical protein
MKSRTWYLIIILILVFSSNLFSTCEYNIKIVANVTSYTTTDGINLSVSNYSNPYRQGDILFITRLSVINNASFSNKLDKIVVRIKNNKYDRIVCQNYSTLTLRPQETRQIEVNNCYIYLDEVGAYTLYSDPTIMIDSDLSECPGYNESDKTNIVNGGYSLFLNSPSNGITTIFVQSAIELQSLQFANRQDKINEKLFGLTVVTILFTSIQVFVSIFVTEKKKLEKMSLFLLIAIIYLIILAYIFFTDLLRLSW